MTEAIGATSLLKKTKFKFITLSLLGLFSVILFSLLALNLHSNLVTRQDIFHQYNVILRDEMVGVRDLRILLETLPHHKEKKFPKERIENLLFDINALETTLSDDIEKGSSVDYFVEEENLKALFHDFQKQTKSFLIVASEILNSDNPDPVKVSELRETSIKASEVLTPLYDRIRPQLVSLQKEGRHKVRQMGWVLMAICILQVVLIWLLVFKPLYETVLRQHERINASMKSLMAAHRSRDEFLTNISHEIRTPMTAILGYAELLKSKDVKKEEVEKSIGIINKNASHLMSLIDEILDISKSRAEKFEYEIERIELGRVINETYSLMNAKALSKGLELDIKARTAFPKYIRSDETRLKQILMNVLGNAIKFTEKGKVDFVFFYNDDTIQFEVTDSGPGIEEDKWETIFHPFEQADATASREHQGTGLGLVLAKELSRGLGGDVFIKESILGKGSTFVIRIATNKEEDGEMIENFSTSVYRELHQDESPEKPLAGRKLLVVDDAKENSRLFKIYLEGAGADVMLASRGEEALELVEKENFEAILLDLQMPGMDGYETLKKLRKEKNVDIPIAALTAHAMMSEKQKTKSAGFNEHITKPIGSKELIRAVQSLLNE